MPLPSVSSLIQNFEQRNDDDVGGLRRCNTLPYRVSNKNLDIDIVFVMLNDTFLRKSSPPLGRTGARSLKISNLIQPTNEPL